MDGQVVDARPGDLNLAEHEPAGEDQDVGDVRRCVEAEVLG